jgi:hypothetical protein
MATITVDQEKLVLNAFAAVFQNNLIAKDLVTWRKYDSEMDDRNGLKVSEQVGPRYVVTETTNGVKDLTGGVQDSVFGSEMFTVNKTFGASMGWGDFVKIRDIGAARESEALRNAGMQLAEQIDKYILEACSAASYNWLGTPANGIDSFGDFVQGYTRLKELGVESLLIRIRKTSARRSLRSTLPTLLLRVRSVQASPVQSVASPPCSPSSSRRTPMVTTLAASSLTVRVRKSTTQMLRFPVLRVATNRRIW